jgi:hypothetical protein
MQVFFKGTCGMILQIVFPRMLLSGVLVILIFRYRVENQDGSLHNEDVMRCSLFRVGQPAVSLWLPMAAFSRQRLVFSWGVTMHYLLKLPNDHLLACQRLKIVRCPSFSGRVQN